MVPDKVVLAVEGMTCSACAMRIEKKLNQLEGVVATVHYASERARIVENQQNLPLSSLIQVIEKAGFQAQELIKVVPTSKKKVLWERLLFLYAVFASICLSLPMLVSWSLSPLWQFLLASPVQFGLGWRFYRGAYFALRSGTANMDVLVGLGTSMAFALSLLVWLGSWQGFLYFETSTIVITLVFLGKLLEKNAKQRASNSLQELLQLQPEIAYIERVGKSMQVPFAEIEMDDIVFVPAKERVAVDGVVLSGMSSVNESMLTGEAEPRSIGVGDQVFAGTWNGDGLLRVQPKAIGKHTGLAKIIQVVQDAMDSKPPIQRFADRVSSIFVPTVVALASITFFAWLFMVSDWQVALIHAISVLVISCPCALGLATPTAVVVGNGLAAKMGILIKDAAALETIASLQVILFDKTGTLTCGTPEVQHVEIMPGVAENFLVQIAHSLEKHSNHPLAASIVAYTKDVVFPLEVEDLQTVPGKGVVGKIADKTYFAGKLELLQENHIFFPSGTLQKLARQGYSLVCIANDTKLLGVFCLADSIREDTQVALQDLSDLGIHFAMLSGDTQESARKFAESIALTDYTAGVLPEQKLQVLREFQKKYTSVAMVGDGINDAPALAGADVSFAMASGSRIAVETADISIVNSRLQSIPRAVLLSRQVLRKIKQNLFFAFIYNVVGIPLAAFGILSPVFAGAAMALSSVSVITNSLLLRNWKTKDKE
ncbi:MAG: heavy metal translocating P-type ATPase [Spirochaetota bacterium]